MPPRLTVGLPVYNGLPFIGAALESLLSQTFNDYEIVISDNASTDGSLSVLEYWAAKDSRVRLIRQSVNRGAAENFNTVVAESRGDYFKWATADDCCRPSMLEQCVDVLDRRPEVALCYAKTVMIDEYGNHREAYEDRLHLGEESGSRRFGRLLSRIDRANAVFGVFRRDVLAETGMIGAFPMSDLVLLGEVALRGQIHEVGDRLFLRRIHPAQSMERYRDRQARAQWFRPGRTPGRLFPCWRVLVEFWKAIERSPLSVVDRAACVLHTRHWMQRYWKDHVKDVRAGVREIVRPTVLPVDTADDRAAAA